MRTTPIPRNVAELEIALGKAILAWEFRSWGFGNPQDYVLELATRTDHIEAAWRWRRANAKGVRAVGAVARRAITAGPGEAHLSLVSDLFGTNLDGVGTFLTTCQPGYFAEVFRDGTKQEGQPLMAFLRILQQFADGA